MAVRKVAIITGVVGLLAIIMAIITYEIILPEAIGKRYITELYSSAERLRTDFENLSGGTDTPLLKNPSAPIDERKSGTVMLKKTIADSQKHLVDLQKKAQALQTLPYSGYTSTYMQALALKVRSERAALQAEDTLNEFSAIITFLDSYTSTIDTTKIAIDRFNQTTDLTQLAGQGEAQRQTAEQIRQDVAKIQQLTSPEEFEPVKSATMQTLLQAADGFDELANGLDLGAEVLIDQAAQKIESAGLQLETNDTSSYIGVTNQSRSIRSVYELNEKLDLILP